MIVKNNPFTSDVYNTEWMNHFHSGKKCHKFDSIKGVAFTKNKYIPLYTNVGKYKSCGISYQLDSSGQNEDYKGKVFLIYDIPEFFEIDSEPKSKRLGIEKIEQYEGYLVDIRDYETINDYLSNQFNSKQRHSVLRRLKKLEKDHDNISYEFYSGKLEEKQFETLFEELYSLMEQQFDLKKEKNSHSSLEIKE